ncbi:alpha-1-antichymotrypsin, partial [Tupaia chinensis]|uniref:alpha-1-antichymotrypsin n=1 Tax=Tupaia chinensis TaxID=246437 RepID=UPI0003C8D2AC
MKRSGRTGNSRRELCHPLPRPAPQEPELRVERMSRLLALGLLVALLCHSSTTLDQENLTQDHQDSGTHEDSLRWASSSTDFGLSLYRQLASMTPGKNVIFSPLSTFTALAFLSLGARNTTLTEILEGLRFNLTEISEAEIQQGFQHLLQTLNQPSDQLQLSMGNALFLRKQLKLLQKFSEDAQGLFAAQAFSTDFQDPDAAQALINDYVKNKTQGKIVDLIKGLEPETVMVLVNYIFFKAKWKTPFDPHDTFQSQFHVSKRRRVKVPMMKVENLWTPYFRDEALSCTVVELPYMGNASALFVLPDQDKLTQVEARLLPETLSRWRRSLQTRWIDELYLPKFSISGDYNLNKVLPQLGFREVFSRDADLSGVTGAKNLVLSQVVHKAVLDVGEVGTEAAAGP